ncbi:SH3 domain-containing protein [Shimia marina]|uniref:SH3 domain protein n=1 Tax=Shimia marina TaxID=321267 RepID=A0A0P1EKT0_9RHOB|nr:SH3 domain-containing protein [Shimia marina]CUH50954.1 SH3 domain protein [Shimia marina]SFD61762.1 SH3 domain-containing protein [Shimia marina]
MNKFILISFGFMGWVFWELSGGSDFEPKSRVASQTVAQATPAASTASTPSDTTTVPLVQAAAASAQPTQVTQPATLYSPSTDGAEIVVASLANGAAAFATPGAPLLSLNAPAESQSEVVPASAAVQPPKPDMRLVRGSRVNMRGGPGTSFGILTVLARGQEVQVLRENGNGWVKLRDEESGQIGWMSAKMITAAN